MTHLDFQMSALVIVLILTIIRMKVMMHRLNKSYKKLQKEARDIASKSAGQAKVLMEYQITMKMYEHIIRNGIQPGKKETKKKHSSETKEYDVDSILDEINRKGIDGISRDKIEFLKRNNRKGST